MTDKEMWLLLVVAMTGLVLVVWRWRMRLRARSIDVGAVSESWLREYRAARRFD